MLLTPQTAVPEPEDQLVFTEVTTEAEPVLPDNPDPVIVEEPIETEHSSGAISVSESDYILLCNAVGHEAGANNISAVEKAKVVEVIMNRVNSPLYPDTIYGVLTQRYQFSGSSTYVDLGTYSHKVTDLVRESVDLYLNHPEQFSEGYTGFYGDGVRNYFR